jgi:hypothetical protein
MKTNRCLTVLSVLACIAAALPAQAADRIRPGQWVGTTVTGGNTYPTSSCISRSDADAINGDAKAVKAYLQTIIPPEICKITDVKADGSQIIYTATCMHAAPKTVTTSYHGDHSEGTDSTGGKTDAKLTGACK